MFSPSTLYRYTAMATSFLFSKFPYMDPLVSPVASVRSAIEVPAYPLVLKITADRSMMNSFVFSALDMVFKVKYDTKRPGPFEKNVTVTSNAKEPSKVVKIKGVVEAAPAAPAPVTPDAK